MSNPNRLPLPIYIDNTMLTSFRACRRQFHTSFVENIASRATSPHLHAGGALAHAFEHTRKAFHIEKLPEDIAILRGVQALMEFWGDYEPPQGISKTFTATCDAFLAYFKEWPLATDPIQPHENSSRPFEHTFAYPIPEAIHPITGDPYLYCGRFDMFGRHISAEWIVDEKSTQGSLGESWASSWDMRGQFIGYTWAGKREGRDKLMGCCVRGIAIQKTQTYFREVFIPYTDTIIQRWYDTLVKDLNRMSECWRNDDWDYNFGEACASYGGCGYTKLCTADVRENWLSMYKPRNWNPLAKDPTLTASIGEEPTETFNLNQLLEDA